MPKIEIELSEIREVTPAQLEIAKKAVDKLVCEWSMHNGHSFLPHELDSLVDKIAPMFASGFNRAFASGASTVMKYIEERIGGK